MPVYKTRFDPAIHPHEGKPRVVAWIRHWTETSKAGYILRRQAPVYSIVGTDYGWLYNTAGDVRFWNSYSGARRHLVNHILPNQWPAKIYRKIDLLDANKRYMCSTNAARDCGEALSNCPGAYYARYAE
jgi:hypothetical protein